jgi:hypothetical protein
MKSNASRYGSTAPSVYTAGTVEPMTGGKYKED